MAVTIILLRPEVSYPGARPRAPSAVQAIRPDRAPIRPSGCASLASRGKVAPSGNVVQLCPTLANRKRDPVAGGCGFAGRPPDRTPGRHFTRPSVEMGAPVGASKSKDTHGTDRKDRPVAQTESSAGESGSLHDCSFVRARAELSHRGTAT